MQQCAEVHNRKADVALDSLTCTHLNLNIDVHIYAHSHTFQTILCSHTSGHLPIHAHTLCVIFEVSQPSAKSGLFISEKAVRTGVRIWNCLHYMLQCFSNGLEHIKLKMNSRSSWHHVARWLSLHFPFSECSIMTTAVTFIACVRLCLCAYTAFVPYAWI